MKSIVDTNFQRLDERNFDYIHERPEYTLVDFEDCGAREVGQIYQEFAVRLMQSETGRVVLNAGGSALEGHYALRDVLRTVMRSAGIPKDLKLALLPGSPGGRGFFQQVLQEFRAVGFNLRMFETEDEAQQWLTARSDEA